MNKRDQKFFGVAEAISETSKYKGVHIGAIIVKKNTIISVGVNAEKSHPIQKKHNTKRTSIQAEEIAHNIHAEMAAIIKARVKSLDGCEVYVYRKNRHGNLAMCRPCPACMHALTRAGVKIFNYTTDQGYIKEEIVCC